MSMYTDKYFYDIEKKGGGYLFDIMVRQFDDFCAF